MKKDKLIGIVIKIAEELQIRSFETLDREKFSKNSQKFMKNGIKHRKFYVVFNNSIATANVLELRGKEYNWREKIDWDQISKEVLQDFVDCFNGYIPMIDADDIELIKPEK